MKYYWLIITLLFGVKLLKGKELSSYNVKWIVAYVVYVLWMQAEIFNEEREWEDIIEPFIWIFFLLPLAAYLLFPFVWKFISKWKQFKKIEEIIDKWYCVIKDLCLEKEKEKEE